MVLQAWGAPGRIERGGAWITFDRLYGAWWERVVHADAGASVQRSAVRYMAALEGAERERGAT
jgi:hypothetical protein